MKNSYYLALGSNIEPRQEYLEKAKQALLANGDIIIESGVYKTEPLGPNGQSWYLNQAIHFASKLSPTDLLKTIKEIEPALGRQPRGHWEAREIDIDILLCNSEVLDTVELSIPHKELPKRNFYLAPLAEIAADIIDPRSQKRIWELLEHSKDKLQVMLYEHARDTKLS